MGILIYILPILIAIGLGLAQFDAGKRQIATLLAQALGPGIEVEFGDFSGSPADLRLDDLTISDAEGVWLDLDSFRFRWTPSALLRGRLAIEEISIARLEIERLPPGRGRTQPGPDDEERRFEIPGLPGHLRGLVVERLAVDRLALGAPVLGEPAVFALDGELRASDPRQQFDLALRLDRQDEPTARLSATAALEPRAEGPPILSVDLQAEESGGLLAAISGTPPGADLALALTGSAPVTDWRGQLLGSADGFGSVDAELGLRAAADLTRFTASAEGRLEVAPRLVPSGAAALLGPQTRFTLRLQRPAEGDRLVVERLTLATGAGEAEAQARIDFAAQTIEGTAKLRLPKLAVLTDLAETPFGGALVAEARFAGPLPLPEAAVDLTIDDLQAVGLAAGQVTGNFRLAALGSGEAWTGLRIDGGGRIADLALDGTILEERNDFDWTLGLDLPEGDPLELRRLSLTGEALALAAAGRLDGQDFALDATLEVADLESLAGRPLPDLPRAPRLDLEANGTLAQPLSASVSGRLGRLEPLPPALAALLGAGATFAGDIALSDGGRLTVSDLSLDGRAASLAAEAEIDFATRDLQAGFDLSVPRLAVLSPALAPGLSGSLRLEGEARGPLDDPTLTAALDSESPTIAGQSFDRASARVTAAGVAGEPKGDLGLHLTRAGETIAARTDFALVGERLVLSQLDLDPDAEIEGEVAIDLGRLLADGALRTRSENIAALSRFFGFDLGGRVALDLRLDPEPDGQDIAADFSGSAVTGPFGAIGEILVEARLRNALADPRGEVRVALSGLRRDEIAIGRLSAELQGGPAEFAFAAAAEGAARDPFDVQAAGAFRETPEGSTLTLDRLAGRFADEPIALAEPATLRIRADGLAVDRLSLAAAGARLELSGGFGAAEVDLQARVTDLPLALARRFGGPPIDGRASGMLSVSGPAQRPEAEIALTASDVAVEDRVGDAPPFDLTLDGRLRDERLRLSLEATRLLEAPIAASATLPLQVSLRPFALSVPASGAIEGRLQAEAELDRVAALLLLDDQRLTGQLNIDLALGGTVAEPRLRGGARIDDGAYQNLVTGTVLTDIAAALTATGTTVIVQDLKASDGGRGTIAGAGSIELGAGGRFPFALDLAFDDAVLVRRDDALAAADGDLAFTGSLGGDALLSGDISIGPAQIRIPDRLPPSVVDLEVIEIGEGGEILARPSAGTDLLGADAISLRLTARAERVFVRGRGLESEWEGAARIGGTVAAPQIAGELEARRGFMDFLGRRLDLARGVIAFPGAQPPAPNVDAVATADIGDGITAEIAVRGDATSPELVVSSQPELPQDEILARLLFGRDMSSITPFQAVKLAAAVDTLRGGSGVDLLGRTRELLGVDLFDIRAATDDAAQTDGEVETNPGATTTLGVGKYIADDVFVEVERGIAAESGAVSVEIEVTPNITVDTTVGADARTGVGVKWRYDY